VATLCSQRFGLRGFFEPREAVTIRSDNGLIFHGRRFRAAFWDCRLSQEFIAPYTLKQNRIIE
jgi:hypothetical protein